MFTYKIMTSKNGTTLKLVKNGDLRESSDDELSSLNRSLSARIRELDSAIYGCGPRHIDSIDPTEERYLLATLRSAVGAEADHRKRQAVLAMSCATA